VLGISWAGLGRRHAGSLGSRQARALCGTMRGACSAEDSAAHAAGAQQLPVASGVRVGRQRKPGDGARDGPLGGLSRVVSTRRCYAGAAGAPAGARLGADAQHAPRPTSGQAGTQCKGKVRRSGEGGGGGAPAPAGRMRANAHSARMRELTRRVRARVLPAGGRCCATW
jgi:hypothetical protein